MGTATLGERFRLFGLIGSRWVRKLVAFLQYGPLLQWRLGGGGRGTLLLAPRDLRTSDPTIAGDIYARRFVLAGQVVEAEGQSVFKVRPPTPEWAEALHRFNWLRHLRASDSALAPSNARALVMDWIATYSSWSNGVWKPETTARRVMVWLSQSPLILGEGDRDSYRIFVRSLTRQVRYLRQVATRADPGLPRLSIAMALCFASLSLSSQTKFIRSSQRRLDAELTEQILLDGGHISRNPAILVELLADLLSLRQTYTTEGTGPSEIMQRSIDRMMPMLRFFRHGDGHFAHFNGTGSTPSDLLATVLAYDDTRGQPLSNASYSGYQRVTAGSSCLIVDMGAPPPIHHSADAHAGCLSFEFSSGQQQLIVNCGSPAEHNQDWHQLARSTAAHSTVTLDDRSSCCFATVPSLMDHGMRPITSGPRAITFGREDRSDGTIIRAAHDGYKSRYDVIHDRELALDQNGHVLRGCDILRRLKSGKDGRLPVALRFHLHPAVTAARSDVGIVLLTLPDGTGWQFAVEEQEALLEDSVYLSGMMGSRRSDQIVIETTLDQEMRIKWSLVCLTHPVEEDIPADWEADDHLPLDEILE